jgi:hypothetical protein
MAELVEQNMTTGYRPKQNIPEHLKDEDWVKHNIDWCISISPTYWKNVENKLYDIYNGNWKDDDYANISNTYGIEFPAGKIKHIPLIRPLLNELEGEYEQRPLNFQIRTSDNDTLSAKMEVISKNLLDDITRMIKSGTPVDVEMSKLEKYYKEDFQTETEIAAHHALHYYIHTYHLKRKLKESVIDRFITGKEYYKVTINRIGEDPKFESIKPGQLYYANNNVRWVKECDWAVYPSKMSPTQVLDFYGERMKPEDIDKVEQWIDMYYRDSYKLNSAEDIDNMLEDTEDWNNQYSSELGMLTVYQVEFKSVRKVYYVENPNPYVKDAPFIKYIPENKLNTLKGESKKNLRIRYVQDLWQGVRIGDNIYVDLGRVKYATRSAGAPSKVNLTFNGPTFTGKVKPYSLIKETRDLQKLYNVLHYHKENLIAISGVKGMVMDASQIPDFGLGEFKENLKMWMYYKKLGTAWIDRSQEGVDKSFNQFNNYDDSLGPGLSAVLSMIQHIEDLAGRIVGVNRQRLGAMFQHDGKGVSENAILQSSLTTEPIFAEHDEFTRQALEDILNACRIAWKNGYTANYISDQYLQEVFTWQPEYSLASLNVHVINSNSDKRSIDELKAFAFQLSQQGMLEFEDIMPLFRKSNLKDIEHQINSTMQRRKKELEAKQAEAAKAEQQLLQAKNAAEMEKLKAEIKKIYAEAETIVRKTDLESVKINQEAKNKSEKLALDTKRIDLEQQELENSTQIALNQNAAQKVRSKSEIKNK